MKKAHYFICFVLAVCVIAIAMTVVRVLTPKVDVFSSMAVKWVPNFSPNAVQQITYTFSKENFVNEILEVKPNANIQDVLDFAESIQVNAEITGTFIDEYDDGKVLRIEYREDIVQYNRLLKQKLGIMFYCHSLRDNMSQWF